MNWLIDECAIRTGLKIELTTTGDFEQLPDCYQTALYRTLQESLTNVIRHAAASHFDVDLMQSSNGVELTVSDNGRGFVEAERSKLASFGLFGLSERAAELNGKLIIDSQLGHGTRLVLTLPPCVAESVPT